MVVQDNSGWKGYPLGLVHEGEETYVVVRWTETGSGEPCHFVTAEEIGQIELLVNKCDKINAIGRFLKP